MIRGWICWCWVLWVGVWVSGCNKTPVEPTGPIAGSETHWLQPCDTSAECGEENACVCGICTRPCMANSCRALGADAVCVPAGSPAAIALCGVLPGEATGICAAECAGPVDCADGYSCETGICVPTPAEPVRISQRTSPPGPPQVDLLLVIDNSGSMCQEQDALTQAFGALSTELAGMDYRIAVVSTDMQLDTAGEFIAQPTPPMATLNCRDANDEPLIPNTADCADFLAGRADPALIRSADVADQAMLETWTRCLTTLGTAGDGFEKGLGATLLALSCQGPNAARFAACCTPEGAFDRTCSQGGDAPDFLRPDAQLAVLFLTDENDCTAGGDLPEPWFPVCRSVEDADLDGVPDAYVDHCEAGVSAADCYARDCGASTPEDCQFFRCAISRTDNSNCEWQRDNLIGINTIDAHLKSLKRDAADVLVWSFVGPERLTEAGDPVRYNPGAPDEMCEPLDDFEACCPDGQCISPIQTSCESAQGEAFSGYRYANLAAASPFGCGPDTGCTICADDLRLEPVAEQLAAARHAACLVSRPICLTGPDLRACATPEERANLSNLKIGVTVDGEPLIRNESWVLEANQRCPSGLLFRLISPERVGENATVQLLYSR